MYPQSTNQYNLKIYHKEGINYFYNTEFTDLKTYWRIQIYLISNMHIYIASTWCGKFLCICIAIIG